VTVGDVTYSSGSKQGDGFVCDIAAITFKAVVEGRTFEKNYIAKFCSEKQREEMARQVCCHFAFFNVCLGGSDVRFYSYL